MKGYLLVLTSLKLSTAFLPLATHHKCQVIPTDSLLVVSMASGPAGSFFNKVPDEDDDEQEEEDAVSELKQPNKKGASGKGFGSPSKGFVKPVKAKKPYTAIGPPDRVINDVTKPETDKDGYTLYENEQTGEKSRVFEALLEYPCDFTFKIVGAKEGNFAEDVVQIVADTLEVKTEDISYSTRDTKNGKWVSVSIQAPVASAELVYQVYENVDKDSRVMYKF